MQALTESAKVFRGGDLSDAARDILAQFQTQDVQGFDGYIHQSHSSPSRKGKIELSITIPRNPTGKRIVASPDSANTPSTPPSAGDGASITVESHAQTNPAILKETQPLPQQPSLPLAHATYQRQPAQPAHPHAHPGPGPDLPKKKKSHARKQPPGHIPRPRNA